MFRRNVFRKEAFVISWESTVISWEPFVFSRGASRYLPACIGYLLPEFYVLDVILISRPFLQRKVQVSERLTGHRRTQEKTGPRPEMTTQNGRNMPMVTRQWIQVATEASHPALVRRGDEVRTFLTTKHCMLFSSLFDDNVPAALLIEHTKHQNKRKSKISGVAMKLRRNHANVKYSVFPRIS